MVPLAWSEGQIAVRAVGEAQTPALHATFLECTDAAALDPTFAEVPESEIAELVERSAADESQERGFRMRGIHVGPAGELAGYFHLMEDVPAAGDAWLSILAIRPRFRRSGVGTAVVARLKRELAAERFPLRPGARLSGQRAGPAVLDAAGVHRGRPASWRLRRLRPGRSPASSCGHRSARSRSRGGRVARPQAGGQTPSPCRERHRSQFPRRPAHPRRRQQRIGEVHVRDAPRRGVGRPVRGAGRAQLAAGLARARRHRSRRARPPDPRGDRRRAVGGRGLLHELLASSVLGPPRLRDLAGSADAASALARAAAYLAALAVARAPVGDELRAVLAAVPDLEEARVAARLDRHPARPQATGHGAVPVGSALVPHPVRAADLDPRGGSVRRRGGTRRGRRETPSVATARPAGGGRPGGPCR